MQYDFAWHSSKEVDPILLFLRSRDCREAGQRTREVRYLREVLKRHPDFVHARLMLLKACWALAQEKAQREDALFARDTAQEFLSRYSSFLKDDERREFQALVDSTRHRGRSVRKRDR